MRIRNELESKFYSPKALLYPRVSAIKIPTTNIAPPMKMIGIPNNAACPPPAEPIAVMTITPTKNTIIPKIINLSHIFNIFFGYPYY